MIAIHTYISFYFFIICSIILIICIKITYRFRYYIKHKMSSKKPIINKGTGAGGSNTTLYGKKCESIEIIRDGIHRDGIH